MARWLRAPSQSASNGEEKCALAAVVAAVEHGLCSRGCLYLSEDAIFGRVF